MLPLLTENAEILWQVTRGSGILKIGSPPPTHGKITTSLADCGTAGLGRGSLEATPSLNGNVLDRVPYYGSMGNVSCPPVLMHSQRLMVIPFVAGTGKSVLWYVNTSLFGPEKLCCLVVLPSSRTSTQCGDLAWRHWVFFTMTIGA
jgi:hypothetical protein